MRKVKHEKIARDFNDKYCEFYKGSSINEEVTQGCWHGFHLSRERLSKLSVEMDVKIVENDNMDLDRVNVEGKVERIRENDHIVTMVSTPVSIRRRYYRDKKKLAEKIDYTAEALCVVVKKGNLQDDEAVREVVCPTCGAIGTKESLYDGCGYCGRKFQVESEERKISAFAVFHNHVAGMAEEMRKNKNLLFLCVGLFAMCVMLATSTFLLKDIMVINVALSKWAQIFTWILLINGVLLWVARRRANQKKVARYEESEALKELCRNCRDFSFTKFTEDLEYKLKTIHFAEKEEDISVFANKEVAKNLSLYANVLDCQLKSCEVTSYHQDENNHYFDTKVMVVLNLLDDNRVIEKEEILLLSFHRIKDVVESKSLVSYSCKGCGSSVNLLNGGICDFCKGQLNLEEYDWVIDSYQSMDVKEDKFHFYTKIIALGLSALILLFNITNIRIAAITTYRGLQDVNAAVYVLGNEMVPSLENYGYAFFQEYADATENGVEYHYRYPDERAHVFVDYPNRLVEEDGFVIANRSDNLVTLQRAKEFSKGTIYVKVFEDSQGKYVVSIAEAD